MRINSIKICNISSYAGVCYFDFKVTADKSVVLIGGQNGTGKTSLFTALKLALYGNLCFNYQSNNGQYLAKVKELINHDAFATHDVKAFIEVEVEMPNEREFVGYTIKREWEYISQKLSEELSVYDSGKLLKESEIIFFQNYLFTILPPNLFDFFFFDGEQIADFFATSNYNAYIKNALLTLCSFDTFEIIRKFCDNYISGNDSSDKANSITSKYEAVANDIDLLEAELMIQDERISKIESDLSIVLSKKEQLENSFKNSGGLTDSQKEELLRKSRELERVKNECNLQIKSFVENMMPFIIAKSVSPMIKEQLNKEDEIKKYLALQDKLSSTQISDAVKGTMQSFNIKIKTNGFIDELIKAISLAVKPDVDTDSFVFLHDLSKEQQDKVYAVLSFIDEFTSKTFIKKIKEKEKASQKTIEINRQLREAMSDIDTASYSKKLNELTKSEFESQKQLERIQAEQESGRATLEKLNAERDAIKEQLVANAKNRNIYDLTGKISDVMDEMITRLTASKFRQIETLMLSMLKKIMSKDNFIDLIELDDSFNIYLYKEQTYQMDEIQNLIHNVGTDELEKRIGSTGVSRLLKTFEIDSISKLKSNFKKFGGQINLLHDKNIDLYKKIELNQLSKGEKQIFILSLYYAIIKASGKDVPFIIDTPYARIDTEHREQISKEYFPTISSQVIVLSTDEEITRPYYNVLKPFLAKEYLLQYDEANSKTTVTDGYFFKG